MNTEKIKKAKFKRSFWGYQPMEVDALLDDIIKSMSEYETRIIETENELRERIQDLEETELLISELKDSQKKKDLDLEKKEAMLKDSIREREEYEKKTRDQIEEFKIAFMSLYNKQINTLNLLPGMNNGYIEQDEDKEIEA